MNAILPLCSSVLSLVFATLVLEQWRQRRRGFQLVWGIGLVWYGIAAGTEFLGSAYGWNEGLYRAWYLIGAFLVAAYLGAGTVYLLARTRFGYFVAASLALGGLFSWAAISKYAGSATAGYVTLGASVLAAAVIALAAARRRELQAHVVMAFLAVGTLVVAALVLTAHVSGAYLDPNTHVPTAQGFPGYLRVISIPFNVAGGLTLVFGALYSAYIYMPKKRIVPARLGVLAVSVNFVASLPSAVPPMLGGKLNSRVPATILIAVGAFIPGLTSSLNRFGVTWSFFLGELLGVVLIFAGFLVSEEVWVRRTSASSLEHEVG